MMYCIMYCLFNKWCWEHWILLEKQWHWILTYTVHKNQLKMDWRLKRKTQNYKTPRRKGGKLHDIDLANDLTPMTPRARATQNKINKWNYIKRKSICTEKNHQNEKTTYRMKENICKPYSWKELIYKICKELIQLNIRNINNPTFKGLRTWINISPKIYKWPMDTWNNAHHH